jgi:uncharacterized protein YaaN involved in tellurite resistance
MSSNPGTPTSPESGAFQLTPPEVLIPVKEDKATALVQVPAERRSAIAGQVDQFVEVLLQGDLHSQPFKDKLDQAFALGRQEVSSTDSLLQGRLLEKNFVDAKDTPAFEAISSLRGELDKLNPGNDGNLLEPHRVLGLIPWGNKLQAYFRRYQSAASQIKTIMGQVYEARDDVQKDIVDIEAQRGRIWEGMHKLAEAIHFAQTLDQKLATLVDGLKATDALRAKAIEQEVLFYARQNLQDMLTQQAVNINGYLALDVIKKTGRELMNGCTRVATTGMSALAVAQTVARATGNQIEVMDMLQGVSGSIGKLIEQTGTQLNQHVQETARFAENPLLGIESIQAMFQQTYQAMDAMDGFRSKAIEVMGRNNEIIQTEIERSKAYVDRARQARPEA